MNLNSHQEKAVLAAVKTYRTWVYQILKDADGSMDDEVTSYFSDMFKTLSESQKILQDAFEKELLDDEGESEGGKVFPPIKEATALICDDDELSRELLGMMLESIGFENCEEAESGKDALDKILSSGKTYDLIICDWKMPGATGLNVHKEAQSAGKLDNTYFVLLTAVEDEVLKSKALRQGIDDYIVKPVEEEVLQEKLESVFEASA